MSLWSVLAVLHYLGGGVCHQIPARSFAVGAAPLPLCARDTGTYLGLMLGLAAILLLRRARASLVPSWPVLAACAAFLLAWGADGLNSYMVLLGGPHLYEPFNALRLLTGTLEGLGLIIIIWPVAAYAFWQQPERRRVITGKELAVVVAVALALVVLVAQPLDAVHCVAGLLSSLGLIGMFTLLNGLLLTVALHREGTAKRPCEVLQTMALAFVPAMLELILLSTLRHWLIG